MTNEISAPPVDRCLDRVAGLGLAAAPSQARTRKPSASEIARICDCAAKYADNPDDGERQCLFNLVADPCMGKPEEAQKPIVVDCYLVENSIWDELLNENYKNLLETLDAWLRHQGSRSAVAEALNLHRNSVGYRMSRVRALLGIDPLNADAGLRLQSALVARTVLQAMNNGAPFSQH